MSGVRLGIVGLLLLLAGTAGASDTWLPVPTDADAEQIARRAEAVLRSDHTFLAAEMTVVSPRLSRPRTVAFRSWDDLAGKRSFIRITAPVKDAGSGFLKLASNLWMYIPRVERTVRIPPSMMLQSWMGSDFTNDDLVKESSVLLDYDQRLLGIDPAPDGFENLRAWVLEYIPHEDAPVVWGKIVAWIDTAHATPLRQDFYDEDGALVRSMRFGDIRPVQDRFVPFLWIMKPLAEKGHETRIQVREIRFDEKFDEDVFSKRHLQRVKR